MCDIKKSIVHHQQLFIKDVFGQEKQCTQKIKKKRVQLIVYKRANLLIVTISALYTEIFCVR